MSHTPGPWKLEWTKRGVDKGTLKIGGVDSKLGYITLASVHRQQGFGTANELPESISAANARLIAAAPKLLDACRDALAFLDRPDITTYEWYKLAPDHVAKFRAAIAEAEG